MPYSCSDLTRKKRFVVEGGKLPGLTAVQLTRSVLCSSMMLTLPGEFSGITLAYWAPPDMADPEVPVTPEPLVSLKLQTTVVLGLKVAHFGVPFPT